MKHIVGFSGGIDSQAAMLWVRNRYPAEDIIALNTQAGRNESPLTVAYIKAYSQDIFPVHEVVPLISDLWAAKPPIKKDETDNLIEGPRVLQAGGSSYEEQRRECKKCGIAMLRGVFAD